MRARSAPLAAIVATACVATVASANPGAAHATTLASASSSGLFPQAATASAPKGPDPTSHDPAEGKKPTDSPDPPKTGGHAPSSDGGDRSHSHSPDGASHPSASVPPTAPDGRGDALPGPASIGVALLSAPGAPTPVLGKSVTAARAEGTVLVEPPGSHHFVALSDAVSTPSNSLVDARRGTIVVATALAGTTSVQMASFNGGEFRVTQSATAGGLTDIELTGGSFATCPRHRPRARAGVAASSHRSTVRRLWANDNHGRFRVHGRDSVATVRGTSLLTVDRCDGTLTSVSKGAVSVRDLHRHRAVLVSAGHSHLAPTR